MIEITSTLKNKPKIKKKWWKEIKDAILGENYNLSLVFLGERRIKKINKNFRNKNRPTNILSFPLDKKEGEIFICWPIIKKEAKKWGRTPENFLDFLLIHGLAHLKGYDHENEKDAAIMEKFEKKIRNKFGV